MISTAIYRSGLSLLSHGGLRSRLTILIYHRVLPAPDAILHEEVDASRFDWQMALVKKYFCVLPLLEAVERLQQGTLPARSIAITFDDGYADNVTVALPILKRHGIHATFFIATAYLDGGRMWNDSIIETVRHARGEILDLGHLGLGRHALASDAQRRRAIDALIGHAKYLPAHARLELVDAIRAAADVSLPTNLMMSTDQVQRLHRDGMGIGGHTCSHPILANMSDEEARREITEGRRALAEIIGEPVSLFAYPNGRPGSDYDARHVRLVREAGFAAAVTTSWGAARRDTDLFQLPRFTPWDRTTGRYLLRLMRNALQRATGVHTVDLAPDATMPVHAGGR